MRMSSEMFPFASHAEYGYDLSYVDAELKVGLLNFHIGVTDATDVGRKSASWPRNMVTGSPCILVRYSGFDAQICCLELIIPPVYPNRISEGRRCHGLHP